jgi:hypothetical protein
MKFTIESNRIVARAENHTDNEKLLALMNGGGTKEVEVKKEAKKHKKHQYKKQCEYCGEKLRGQRGLNIHKAKIHKYADLLSRQQEFNS